GYQAQRLPVSHAFHTKIVAAAAAPLLGALTDVAFRPTRSAGVVLGIVFAMAGFWVYLRVLGQRPAQELVLYAVGITVLTALTVAFSVLSHAEPERAGAAGVGLGAAVALGAWLYAWRLDLLGCALAAACGGFLLLTMAWGRGVVPGTSLTLSSGVYASLLAAGAVLQGRLAWYAAAGLVLVPLAVRLPLPQRAPAAAQALLALLYALAAAGGVCALAWFARRG
ncbi:MAG: hypothetical protein ACREUN_09300, partial [Burkholderiales bacterium]